MKQYKSNAFLHFQLFSIMKRSFVKHYADKINIDKMAARGMFPSKSKLCKRLVRNMMRAELRKKQMKTITGTHDTTSPKCIFRQAIYQNRG